MVPKDKYTIFDKKEKNYRKGIHSMCLDALVWVTGGYADRVCHRTAQVDTSEPASQSSGFLKGVSITTFDCWAKSGYCRRYNAYRTSLYDIHHKTLARFPLRRRGDGQQKITGRISGVIGSREFYLCTMFY